VVGWAESSAVQYANSVLGARTNRNSVLVDVCMAVTGFAPEFGYLLDENRRGRILVKQKIDSMDAAALGFLIGQKLVDRVPVIEHYPFSTIELKNMGGAMAAAGGVAMFHVEGLTPEAPDMKTAFDGDPEEVLTVTQKDLDALCSTEADQADLVVFGCPQMTYEEAVAMLHRFEGGRSTKPVWFCLIPEALERFQSNGAGSRARQAGIELYDHCPLAALTVRVGRRRVLTSSGKLYYYLSGSHYGTVDNCLRACGVRS
jgi:predicted aconitase